jgi:hypothetical protein
MRGQSGTLPDSRDTGGLECSFNPIGAMFVVSDANPRITWATSPDQLGPLLLAAGSSTGPMRGLLGTDRPPFAGKVYDQRARTRLPNVLGEVYWFPPAGITSSAAERLVDALRRVISGVTESASWDPRLSPPPCAGYEDPLGLANQILSAPQQERERLVAPLLRIAELGAFHVLGELPPEAGGPYVVRFPGHQPS